MRFFGHVITHDWTRHEAEIIRDPVNLARYSQLDLDGVRTADAVVAIFRDPDYAYRGTFAELGAAIVLGKTVVVCDLAPAKPRAAYRDTPFFWDAAVGHVHSTEAIVHRL